ncbi:Uncharacterized protein TCM_036569 [Theobroma cacao]|uniref:Uncharacterized protein n=1 Tax=Theobroma cacao TaxID=3641 RepID=A0A061FJ87_THECC|nr:Uncharacterized protein TCM_036569 [Theobroma cacao]
MESKSAFKGTMFYVVSLLYPWCKEVEEDCNHVILCCKWRCQFCGKIVSWWGIVRCFPNVVHLSWRGKDERNANVRGSTMVLVGVLEMKWCLRERNGK